MWLNPPFPAVLFSFTEKILNGKLHFFLQNTYFWIFQLNFEYISVELQPHSTEMYSETCQTTKMEQLAKIVNDYTPLTIFVKRSILDVWQSSGDTLLFKSDIKYEQLRRELMQIFQVHFKYSLNKMVNFNYFLFVTKELIDSLTKWLTWYHLWFV